MSALLIYYRYNICNIGVMLIYLSQRSTIVEITMADVITCARRRPLGGAAVAETASDWLATTGSATVNAKTLKTARTQLGTQSLFRFGEVPYLRLPRYI